MATIMTIVTRFSLTSFDGASSAIGIMEGRKTAITEARKLRTAARRSKFQRRITDRNNIGILDLVVMNSQVILVQPTFTFGIKDFEELVIRAVSRVVTAIYFAAGLRQLGTAIERLKRVGFILVTGDGVFTRQDQISAYVQRQIRQQIP